ncbi:MAG: hypothetical protein B7Z22_00285 [Hyphomonas sp. 32-62-5]|nr:MAG: hypothetical protein B7Z22_00285 [Hyphomonas sp. 32-62-5]
MGKAVSPLIAASALLFQFAQRLFEALELLAHAGERRGISIAPPRLGPQAGAGAAVLFAGSPSAIASWNRTI